MKKLRYYLFALAACFALGHTVQAQTGQIEPVRGQVIYYHEPLDLSAALEDSAEANAGAITSLTFYALDRMFELRLERNDRLIAKLPRAQRDALGGEVELYRGRLLGNDASWVRLTRVGKTYSGMIWDGAEAYVIDASAAVAGALDAASDAPESYTLIYRLSDMTMGSAECGLDPDAKPMNDYAHLMQHLDDMVGPALAAASAELDIAVIADRQFTQANGAGAAAAVVARMNVVDGIYSEQVGVHLNVTEVRTLSNNGSLTSTNASTLLDQFANLSLSSALNNPGLAHLFTGRSMNGNTIGIAWVDGLCSDRFGVGLSETRGTGTAGALTVAHEIGHNFGARHDNQSGSPCASTSGNFLMNPFFNGSDQFSQCSLEQIQPRVNTASCIRPILSEPDGVDLVIEALNATQTTLQAGGVAEFTLRTSNRGTQASTAGVYTRIALSSDALIDANDLKLGSVWVPALAAGAFSEKTRTVTIPANVGQGRYYIGAIVDRTDRVAETDEANNALTGQQLSIQPGGPAGADLIISAVSATPSALLPGELLTFTVRTANQGTQATSVGVYTRLVLSNDAVIDETDRKLRSVWAPPLAVGAFSEKTRSVAIPADVAQGSYFIGAIVDRGDRVTESDEGNNTQLGPQLRVQ